MVNKQVPTKSNFFKVNKSPAANNKTRLNTGLKTIPVQPAPRAAAPVPFKRVFAPPASSNGFSRDELSSLKEAARVIHQVKISAQHELELARKMRADALKYQQETAARARSEAQQLILKTRLLTQRETEELIRQASEEIQKVLADIRMIRIMAQEELAAQRKFTDSARIRSISLAIKDGYEPEKSSPRKKKQLAAVD
jgi:hypothetical protein